MQNINFETLTKLKIKYRTLTNKELLIKVVEKLMQTYNYEKFKIYHLKLVILKLKRKDLKDKQLKQFIKDCKII